MNMSINIIVNYKPMMAIATLLFIKSTPKKKHWRFKITVWILLQYLISFMEYNIFQGNNFLLETFSYIVFFFVFGLPFMGIICEKKLVDNIFFLVCGIATQHFAASFEIILRIISMELFDSVWFSFESIYISLISYIIVFITFYFIFSKPLEKFNDISVKGEKSFWIVLSITPIIILLSCFIKYVTSKTGERSAFFFAQIYAMVCCFYMLWILINQQKVLSLQKESILKENLWKQQKQQWNNSKQNIEVINRKCHDLRHQISAIERMDKNERKDIINEIRQAIDIYDSTINTGNEAVDVVLTEKSLFGSQNNIKMACMIDGSILNKIGIIDIYTILGNAIDNAIECVIKVIDSELRYISINIFKENNFIMIVIENFCEKEPLFKDGIPVTTKENKDDHGIGIRSIIYIVEKYNGCVNVKWKNKKFSLKILIPAI